MVDVDAFRAGEASVLAAGHWGVETTRLLWTDSGGAGSAISTHDAARSGMALERSWWYATRFITMIVIALAAAYVVRATIL